MSTTRLLHAEHCPQLRHSRANPGLHGAERGALSLGDLTVREPLEVRDLERPALLGRQLVERRAEARGLLALCHGFLGRRDGGRVARIRAARVPPGARAAGGGPIATLRTSCRNHARGWPRAGSYRSARRQRRRNASCTASSAAPRSPVMRRARPYARGASRSYSAASACSSPCATRARSIDSVSGGAANARGYSDASAAGPISAGAALAAC